MNFERNAILAVAWIDNGAVQILSTVYEVETENTILRLLNHPRIISTSGPRVR